VTRLHIALLKVSGKSIKFFSSQKRQNQPRDQLILLFSGHQGKLRDGKDHLLWRLRMRGAIPPLPSYGFMKLWLIINFLQEVGFLCLVHFTPHSPRTLFLFPSICLSSF